MKIKLPENINAALRFVWKEVIPTWHAPSELDTLNIHWDTMINDDEAFSVCAFADPECSSISYVVSIYRNYNLKHSHIRIAKYAKNTSADVTIEYEISEFIKGAEEK